MSSNSVFLFILGLTVGLLISMTLLSRYHRYHPDFVVKDLPTEVMTQQGMAKKFAGPSSLQGNMQPDSTPKSEQALPVPKKSDNMKIDSTETKSSASFWIPGREGAFVKSKSPGGSAPSSSSGIDLIADFFGGSGKETNGEENQDSFSGVGKNRRNNGRKNNASGGGSDSQQGADEESESNSERMSSGGPGNGNGKRRKGPKGSRGRDAQDSAITSVLPADPSPSAIENATALMKRFFVHVAPSGNFAADDISMQSRFFNDKGDRVDAMGGEGGEGVMLYDHPPLQPYHSQAHLKHPLPRPYAPSLASVIAQRAAMLQDNDKPLTSKPKSYYSTR